MDDLAEDKILDDCHDLDGLYHPEGGVSGLLDATRTTYAEMSASRVRDLRVSEGPLVASLSASEADGGRFSHKYLKTNYAAEKMTAHFARENTRRALAVEDALQRFAHHIFCHDLSVRI